MSVFIVAEIGPNHDGSLERAHALIEAAKSAGSDAVKFVTARPQDLTCDSDMACYQIRNGPWKGWRLWDLYTKHATPFEWHGELFRHARDLKLVPFSTPQSPACVDFLESLDCPIYKVASFELTDFGLLDRIVRTGRAAILSTGLAQPYEIKDAVARWSNRRLLTLLHCVSAYPTPVQAARIGRIQKLWDVFPDLGVGLSDHSLSLIPPIAATALGATVIEKHLRLDDGSTPLDAGHSLTPTQFGRMVQAVRDTEKALGTDSEPVESHSGAFRRRWVFRGTMRAGDVIGAGDLRTARCAEGLLASQDVLGFQVERDVVAFEPVTDEVLYG